MTTEKTDNDPNPNYRTHYEAFLLMNFASEDGVIREKIWNSRDGAVPHQILDRQGDKILHHVDWNEDAYLRDYLPNVGDRIFVNLREEHVKEFIVKHVENDWEHPEQPLSGMYDSKESAIEALLRFAIGEGNNPYLFTVTAEWRDKHIKVKLLEGVFESELDKPEGSTYIVDSRPKAKYIPSIELTVKHAWEGLEPSVSELVDMFANDMKMRLKEFQDSGQYQAILSTSQSQVSFESTIRMKLRLELDRTLSKMTPSAWQHGIDLACFAMMYWKLKSGSNE